MASKEEGQGFPLALENSRPEVYTNTNYDIKVERTNLPAFGPQTRVPLELKNIKFGHLTNVDGRPERIVHIPQGAQEQGEAKTPHPLTSTLHIEHDHDLPSTHIETVDQTGNGFKYDIISIKPSQTVGGTRKSRKSRSKKRKTRKSKRKKRRHRTKRRVKRRRKTTRKKRGRGMGPSKMAKVGVAALAASEMMKQGTAAVSPQARTVQQQLRSADCTTIKEQGRQLIIPLHPDHGGTDEDFITGMNELNHRRGQCKLNRKRGDTGRNKPTRNPNTGKPMSKKKYKQQQKRRRNQQRQEKARERARTQRQQEADARAGRRQQQENTESTGTNYMKNIGVGAAAVGAAGLVAREMGRGRPRVRNTRIVTRNDGSRVLVRNDGSIIRELTPERR